MSDSIICDTTVLLYLARMKQLQLLKNLFVRIYTTETVCQELDAGRLTRSDTIDPRELEWIEVVDVTDEQLAALPENQLDAGEQTVLAYAYTNGLHVVGLDDQLAREFAKFLKVNVIGTIGILIRAKRKNLIPEIRSLLDQLSGQGFYISKPLLKFALYQADEI